MRQELAKRLGKLLTPTGRRCLGDWVRGSDRLFIPYDGVKDWNEFGAILRELDFHDGAAGVTISLGAEEKT